MGTGEFNAGGNPAILGFHVTSEKTKIKLNLKILSFYLYRVKVIFNEYLLACLQLGRPLCSENRTRFFTMRDIGIVCGLHVTCTKILIRLMFSNSE